MTRHPAVTVLLPAYNPGELLSSSVASILNQHLEDLELLLIDDGSTDGSIEPVANQWSSDSRLRVLRQPNAGLAAALNRGIDEARADLVARMDCDDLSHPERLAVQVPYLKANPECVLLGSQINRVVNGQRTSCSSFPMDHGRIMTGLLKGQHVVCHPSVVMRRAAVISAGKYWNHGVSEDWDLYLKLSRLGQLANLSDVLLDYRFHASGINAVSMSDVRFNIHLAIENHRRSEEKRKTLEPAEFGRSASWPLRFPHPSGEPGALVLQTSTCLPCQ